MTTSIRGTSTPGTVSSKRMEVLHIGELHARQTRIVSCKCFDLQAFVSVKTLTATCQICSVREAVCSREAVLGMKGPARCPTWTLSIPHFAPFMASGRTCQINIKSIRAGLFVSAAFDKPLRKCKSAVDLYRGGQSMCRAILGQNEILESEDT